jgi:hypothetical protein
MEVELILHGFKLNRMGDIGLDLSTSEKGKATGAFEYDIELQSYMN